MQDRQLALRALLVLVAARRGCLPNFPEAEHAALPRRRPSPSISDEWAASLRMKSKRKLDRLKLAEHGGFSFEAPNLLELPRALFSVFGLKSRATRAVRLPVSHIFFSLGTVEHRGSDADGF